jgi:type IV pilus biogenesis protein CpaD/CtpE
MSVRPTARRIPAAVALAAAALLSAACGTADPKEAPVPDRAEARAPLAATPATAPAAAALPGAPVAPEGLRLATFAVG